MYFHSPPEWTVIGFLGSGFFGWLVLYGYLFMLNRRPRMSINT
jgi:hypothetical protein